MVKAEETCTQEKINSYLQYIDKYTITFKEMDNSGTYQVWASGVVGGIALDHGRIVFNEGFLGYVVQGEVFNIKVYVADGSVCAGETVKNIQVYPPKKEIPAPEPSNPTISEPSNPQPTNPPSNNNNDNSQNNDGNQSNNNQNNIVPPNVNQDQPIDEIISNDDTNSNSAVDNNDDNTKINENNQIEEFKKEKNNNKEENKVYLIVSVSFLTFAILLIIAKSIFNKIKLKGKAS